MVARTALGVSAYVLCSSLMLVANKVTLSLMPLPAIVFTIQLASAAVFIWFCKMLGVLSVDEISLHNVKLLLPYTMSFAVGVYTSGKSLEHSNVETVIVFRSCAPLLVSVIEWAFLDRMLPSRKSTCALVALVLGAIGYLLADSEVKLQGVQAYAWLLLYLMVISCNLTYGKLVTSRVTFESPVWGLSLYTNLLSCPWMVLLGVFNEEVFEIDRFQATSKSLAALAVSSAIGIGISWSAWNCTRMLTATTYTLIGVLCKLLSVLVNVMMWDKHASPLGIAWLVVCICAGTLYEPAPIRPTPDGSSKGLV